MERLDLAVFKQVLVKDEAGSVVRLSELLEGWNTPLVLVWLRHFG